MKLNLLLALPLIAAAPVLANAPAPVSSSGVVDAIDDLIDKPADPFVTQFVNAQRMSLARGDA